MKKGVVLLVLTAFVIPTILATVSVNKNSLENEYVSGENLRGKLGLNISGEEIGSIISSGRGDQITLESLLDKNGAIYSCSVLDCSNEYSYASELSNGQLQINTGEKEYVGFVLQGSDVEIDSIYFDLESNFVRSAQLPLSFNFFERVPWNFNEFSDEFSAKVGGCYDQYSASPGSLIGTEGYCEKIPVSATAAIRMEAKVTSEDDNKEIIMELYEKSGTSTGGSPIKSCTYNPGQGQTSCTISADNGEVFESEDYYACVRASTQTNYKIYDENNGENCGFLFSKGPLNSIKDFAIFLSFAKYENASKLDSSKIDFSELALAADDLINIKYGRDCQDECVLPIEIQGIDQTLKFSNISLYYKDSGGILREEKIKAITSSPPTVNFSGNLEMSYAEFPVTSSGIFSIFFNQEKIVQVPISIITVPIITNLYPLDPPAGSPIEFTAVLSYAGSPTTIEYHWDFGDGQTQTTTTNKVIHTYSEIKDYILKIRLVSSNGLSSEKSFRIFAKDPLVSINETLQEKKSSLEEIIDRLNNAPPEYKTKLEELLGIKELQSKMSEFERELSLSSDQQSLAKLGSEVYALDIPSRLDSVVNSNILLVQDIYGIDASPVAEAEGVQKRNLDNYREKILEWQAANIVAKISSVSYSAQLSGGQTNPLLRSYNLNVRSKSQQEGFIVINSPSDELFFKDQTNPIESGEYSVIPLGAMEQKILEFYNLDLEELSIFVSPKLSEVIIQGDIDTTCNFNLICEEDLGESPSSCRTDCKPAAQAGFYLAAAVIFLLIFYTALQIWYKRNYENYLFGDKRHLYNLIMYVTNAQARGMSSSQISENLQKHGWSKERIRYVIRKANGQSNGLYEIIPVDKIIGISRRRSAKKELERKNPNRLLNPPRVNSNQGSKDFQQGLWRP